MAGHGAAHSLKECTDADAALARVRHIYETGVDLVRTRFARFVAGERRPDAGPIKAFYPYLGLSVRPEQLLNSGRPPHGAVPDPGTYGSTLTHPDIFGDYFREQIVDLMRNLSTPE
ncbi:MAG: hypothetical protein EXQ88_06065 [Alphaproteobacteria bacterium]|nr:hypothetical protein [Alphaproteobacteria bacterium]